MIAEANRLGASVLLTFCLPFQATLDRCTWSVVTVRKHDGTVIDGEMSYSSCDDAAAPIPPSVTTEHLPGDVLEQLEAAFRRMMSPLDLDALSGGSLSSERANQLAATLQNERRKMIRNHKHEISKLENKHAGEMAAANLEIAAIKDAAAASARLVEQTDGTTKTTRSSLEEMRRNRELLEDQLSAQLELTAEIKARLAGERLEKAEASKRHQSQVKKLEEQLSVEKKHRTSCVVQLAASAKAAKAATAEAATANRSRAEAETRARSMQRAAEAVSRSREEASAANEAMRLDLEAARAELVSLVDSNETAARRSADVHLDEANELRGRITGLHREVHAAKQAVEQAEKKAAAAVRLAKEEVEAAEASLEAASAKARAATASSEAASMEAKVAREEAAAASAAQAEAKAAETKANAARAAESVEAAATSCTPSMVVAPVTGKIVDDGAQADDAEVHQESELMQTKKKARALETRLRAMEGEMGRMRQSHPQQMQVQSRRGPPPQQPPLPHSYGMPQGYILDPSLEASISHLHSCLQNVTAAARSASTNARSAHEAQLRLEATGNFYFDSNGQAWHV